MTMRGGQTVVRKVSHDLVPVQASHRLVPVPTYYTWWDRLSLSRPPRLVAVCSVPDPGEACLGRALMVMIMIMIMIMIMMPFILMITFW